MSPKSKSVEATATTLTDDSVPFEHRKMMLGQLCLDSSSQSTQIIQHLLGAAAQGNGESLHAKKAKELADLMEELRKGPLRPATYLDPIPGNGSPAKRVHVRLQSGDSAYPVLTDEGLGKSLRAGDTVLIDGQARAVLFRVPDEAHVGEEARLERLLDGDRVEAVLRDHEPFVFRVSAALADQLQAGQVEPGCRLLVCSRRAMAFDAVPLPAGSSRYRFLAREGVPDVIVSRDVGNPPAFIEEFMDHLRTEMLRPELGRRYHVRRARTKFLSGVSGSGKTLSIHAFWRQMYELMSEVTGTPVDQLPPRVFRLRMPQVLSKWLGESDKNLDRFFDEVEQLADEPFIGARRVRHVLPVLAICEEIDGFSKARGTGDDVYDRIQTTALERLDVNSARLKDRLIIFVFTSNVARLVDPAFMRRAGGTSEQFGRLTRRAFIAVIEKHLRGLPFRKDLGRDQSSAERRVLRDVTDWLYADDHDPGQVELTFVGSSTPVTKYRRDFLTGALVDRAVQQAAAEACHAERLDTRQPGISSDMLMAAFDAQVRSLASLLDRHNASDYLTLPDGVRVGDVRRIDQPTVQPFQLERRRA